MTPIERRDEIARELNHAGWTCEGGEHEPDNYDDCDECQRVDKQIADALMPRIEEWLETERAEAWDEGAQDGEYRPNPYRPTSQGDPEL